MKINQQVLKSSQEAIVTTVETKEDWRGNHVGEVMRGGGHGKHCRCSTEEDRKPAKVFRRGMTNLVLILKGTILAALGKGYRVRMGVEWGRRNKI